jgi:hypothetical protein
MGGIPRRTDPQWHASCSRASRTESFVLKNFHPKEKLSLMKLTVGLASLALLSGACSSANAPTDPSQTGGSTPIGAGATATGASGTSTSTGASQGSGGNSGGAPPAANSGSAGAASGFAGAGSASAGAGTGGASAGGASTGCTPGGATLFCEDFESYATGPAMAANGWTPVTGNGTLTIDSTHAQGKNALHVQTQDNGKAYIHLSLLSPPQSKFYGRMRVWATAFPTMPDYAHFTMVEAAGTEPGVVRPIGGQYIPGKGDLWGAGSDAGPTGDWTNWKESAPAEAGKWLCLEWSMAPADNEIQIWIDGAPKPDLTVNTKLHGGSNVDFVFPKFNSIWFGWWLYQSGSAPPQFDLWLDDLALGAERLGCGG